ncbi:T6SS effector BTH_I2691 family protein [Pseudothauera lacus]|uniref:Toxin VasX N-terminal region domain-containing protein n=1 Tax=Pseudothauera lacus TaxID=2136175 RepID=A0A2T4IEU5_9RHOO|nr:T6SS effector BTH_I2691 family protein [Pseudothauera lacus]PTD96294.1 hypothetical protein C8261_10265 [Pseudothauera lacus]
MSAQPPTTRAESPPPIVAHSVTSPISNTRRKEVLVRDSRHVDRPPADPHVALLPVRYAVAQRTVRERVTRYTAPTLKRNLPAINRASYVLRHLRAGMVYVFARGKLHDFAVTAGGHLRPHGAEAESSGILIEFAALLFPQSWGEIYIAFSDHEWSPAQRRRAIADVDGARTRGMQRFSLATPQDDAFGLDALGTEVEEYAGRASQYTWSDHPAAPRRTEDYQRLPELARGGAHVIALDDPIGISHDLAALVENALKELADYVQDPDEPEPGEGEEAAAKQAESNSATGIPSLVTEEPAPNPALDARRARYRRKIIADTIGRLYENSYSARSDPDTLARMRLEHWRGEPANRGKSEPTLAELRRDVVTGASTNPAAARLIKHVDEAARRKFLREFDAEVSRLNRELSQHRQDRLAWLHTWAHTTRPDTLKAAWARFDMDDEQDWRQFELSFARSMAALGISPDGRTENVFDGEMALFGQWLATAVDDSPLYRALFGHTPLRQHVIASATNIASGAEGAANAIEAIYRLFPATVGTDEIVHVITVYTITRSQRWRGAVLGTIDNTLDRIAGSTAPKELGGVLQGRYGSQISVEELPPQTQRTPYPQHRPGPTPPSTRWDPPARTGTLHAEGRVQYRVTEVHTTRHAPTARPSPLRGWGTAGVSALAGLVYMLNMKRALESFDTNDAASYADIGAAAFAVGSGIHGGLHAFRGAAPVAFDRGTRALATRYAIVAERDLVNRLMGLKTYRFFGYGGAFLGGAVFGIDSYRRLRAGDTDAGLWYAGAAVTAVAGGSAMTHGGAMLVAAKGITVAATLIPAGWLILGVVLIGTALVFTVAGDNDEDTPVERWLDSSSFGLHSLSGSLQHEGLREELDVLSAALYAPQIVNSELSGGFAAPFRTARATVRMPGYHHGISHIAVTVNGHYVDPEPAQPGDNPELLRFAVRLPKNGATQEAHFNVRYQPSVEYDAMLELDFVVR